MVFRPRALRIPICIVKSDSWCAVRWPDGSGDLVSVVISTKQAYYRSNSALIPIKAHITLHTTSHGILKSRTRQLKTQETRYPSRKAVNPKIHSLAPEH